MRRLVALLLLWTAVASAQVELSSVTVTPDNPQARMDLHYRTPVLVAVEGQVLFDPTLVAVELTWYYEEGWLVAQNIKPGILDTLHFAAAGLDPLSDTRVGYLTVTYLSDVPGTATLTWHQASHNNADRTDMMDAIATDGSITLSGHDGVVWATPIVQVYTGIDGWRQPIKVTVVDSDLTEAPRVEVVNVTQGTMLPVATTLEGHVWRGQLPTAYRAGEPGLRIALNDQVQVHYYDEWDAQGQAVRREVALNLIPLWGNVSYTGWLNILDAWLILRMYAGELVFDPVADLTGSGTATPDDALLLLERLVLMRLRFPIQDGLE